MDFVVIIHTAEEGGYWAEVPALGGCFAQGESIDDVLDEARSAIRSHLDALADDGQPIADGAGIVIAMVRVPAA